MTPTEKFRRIADPQELGDYELSMGRAELEQVDDDRARAIIEAFDEAAEEATQAAIIASGMGRAAAERLRRAVFESLTATTGKPRPEIH